MDDSFERWATVELLGQEGETFDDVINRISKEAISKPIPMSHGSFINIDWDAIVIPPKPLPSSTRYIWKDSRAKTLNQRLRTNPSGNLGHFVSVAAPSIEQIIQPEVDVIPAQVAGDEGTPIVMTRGIEMALFTKRQEQRAMDILLGKEHDGKD